MCDRATSKIIHKTVSQLGRAKFEDIYKTAKEQKGSIKIKEVITALQKGIESGLIEETRGGRYQMQPASEISRRVNAEEQASCSKTQRKHSNVTSLSSEGCNITFTRRCSPLERLLASESFEDLSLLMSPAYLDCFVEQVTPEPKCQRSPDSYFN